MERANGVLQDRLVKLMRLAGIASWEAGNAFLPEFLADYNDRLSCERALSARRYLVVQHGIDADRLVPMGFGFEKLKDPLQPRAAVNRRVEIRRFAGLQKTGQP